LTQLQIDFRWPKSRRSGSRNMAPAVLAAVLAFWFLASPAQAFGGGIEVLEDGQEVDFPGGLSFTLAAQGDADIVEVRLLYRIVGSDVWSYAYPDFSPGARIATNLTLSIGGSAYLPPGTELDYYYIIRDAQGNVHQTDAKLIEYSDNRFQWERVQIGRLVLLHHGLSQSRVDSVSREVEGVLDYLLSLLKLDAVRPIKGVIYNSDAEARPAFPKQSETFTEAHVFAGFAFPSTGVFVGIGFQPRIIVHETAHLLFEQAVGPDALPVPAWLDEGFASYVEPDSTPYSGRSLSSQSLPLRSMTRISGTPRGIATFYRKAESVVAYLIQDYGVEPFQQLLGELAQGRTTEEALLQIYGFGVSELDAHWASDAQGPPAPARGSHTRGYPWVNSSGLVLGVLAVAVSIAMVFRYAVRRLRSADNPEDGLQPWEDPDLLDLYDDQ
jgi:hypothetical protein